MGTRFDPNHPARPRGYIDTATQAYRDHGEEAPWLLAWRGGEVMINPETGRYMYDSEIRDSAGLRGRGGKRH